MDGHQEEWRNSFANFEQALDEEDGEAENEVLALVATAINKMERHFISSILSNPTVQVLVKRTLARLNLVGEDDDEDEMYETVEEDETSGPFSVTIQQVNDIPVSEDFIEKSHIVKSGYFVTVSVLRGRERESVREFKTSVVASVSSDVLLDETIDLGTVRLDDTLCFTLHSSYVRKLAKGIDWELGKSRVLVKDLVAQAYCEEGESLARAFLWITDAAEIVVFDYDLVNPTKIVVNLDINTLPKSFPRPMIYAPLEKTTINPEPQYAKHAFVVTRGTRGDVQPFIALARGLAEQHNWLVTICTESRYLPLIQRYSEVKRGKIQFRTSGGDTEKRIDGAAAQWAFKQKADLLQVAILARSEREFFDAEPAYHYWASLMQPDVLLFGFTTMNIAMILSESLRIPMIGFLLQPTVIPLEQYPATVPIESKVNPSAAHKWNFRAKQFFENNPLDVTSTINYMRIVRGLQPFSYRVNNIQLMLKQQTPLIIPINDTAFGGRPKDWQKNLNLTNFIFLRTGAVPNLKPRIVKMIIDAKVFKEPLVAMCFSSMPISRDKILELALLILENCSRNPRVIALAGNAKMDDLPSENKTAKSIDLEQRAKAFIKQGRLLLESGAPYSKLFPQMDYVIMHGGLGTTAECLRAGVPCLVTGILLLDQRFWGQRVHDLGVAEKPVHITDLHKVLVSYVDRALAPGNKFAKRAKEVATLVNGETEDGVAENVRRVAELAESAKPVETHRESMMKSPQAFANALAKDVSNTVRAEAQELAKKAVKEGEARGSKLAHGLKLRYEKEARELRGIISTVLVHNAHELRSLVKSKLIQAVLDRENED